MMDTARPADTPQRVLPAMRVEIFAGSSTGHKRHVTTDSMRRIWALRPGHVGSENRGQRAVAVAWALKTYWDANKKTEIGIALELNTTAGQIHHYLSIAKDLAPELRADLAANRLVFKEARSLADLETWDRQREIGQLFTEGLLSSVHVEQAVSIARKYPELRAQDVYAQVIPSESKPPLPEPVAKPVAPRRGRPPSGAELTVDQLQQELVYAAGVMKCTRAGDLSYVEGRGVLLALRQVQTATSELMAALS